MNIKQFIELIRVPSLSATAIPLLLGLAISYKLGSINAAMWIDLFVVALLMQIATNMANEHGDYIHGVDKRASYGFAGLIVKGEVSSKEIRNMTIATYTFAGIFAVPLVLYKGFVILLLGLFALAVSVLYSEGPLPLSKTPFGEIAVGIVMGFVELVATQIVTYGEVTSLGLVCTLPVALFVASILTGANIRDIKKDKDAGRKTLAVLLGSQRARTLYYSMLLVAYASSVAIAAYARYVAIFFVLATIPLAVVLLSKLNKSNFKYAVKFTSLIYLLFGIAFALAIITPLY